MALNCAFMAFRCIHIYIYMQKKNVFASCCWTVWLNVWFNIQYSNYELHKIRFPFSVQLSPKTSQLLPVSSFQVGTVSNRKLWEMQMSDFLKTMFQDSSQLLSSFNEVPFFGRHWSKTQLKLWKWKFSWKISHL